MTLRNCSYKYPAYWQRFVPLGRMMATIVAGPTGTGRVVLIVVLLAMLSLLIVFKADLVIILFLVLLLAAPMVHSAVYRQDLISPINLFALLYMISFVAMPMLSASGLVSIDPAYVSYDKSYEFKARLLSIFALLFLYLGYYENIVSYKLGGLPPKFRRKLNQSKTKLWVVIISLISVFSFIHLAKYYKLNVKNLFEYFIYTNVSSFGRGHLAFLCYSYVYVFLISILVVYNRHIRPKLFFGFFILLSAILAFFTRSRGHILFLLFVLALFYHYRVKKIGLAKSMFVFSIVLVIVFVVGQFRGTRDFRVSKPVLYEAFGGLFAEFQATAALLSEYEQKNLEHYNGRIFFEDTVLSLIPRAIWPSKPKLYGGVLVTNVIVPNRQAGFYYTTGTFGCAFADFGYVGVMFAMFLAGVLMRIVYNYLRQNTGNDFVLLIYAVSCFYIWAFVRGGFGSAPGVFQALFPTMLICFLVSDRMSDNDVQEVNNAGQ